MPHNTAHQQCSNFQLSKHSIIIPSMTERKIKLTIAYDGSAYRGWQRQAQGIPTVQQTIEAVLARVVKHPVRLRASGRTDTAVHALGQVANFRTNSPIPSQRLALALNARLPKDIRIRRSQTVPDNFDAIASAHSKLYRYTVFNHTDMPAQLANYAYHFWLPCNLPAMQHAARALVGTHDFASFAAAGQERLSTVRTLLACHIHQKYHNIYFDLEGTGFLYHMVRNIVATLLEIGRGFWPPERIHTILAAADRSVAGPMAPPQGLCLQWVKY